MADRNTAHLASVPSTKSCESCSSSSSIFAASGVPFEDEDEEEEEEDDDDCAEGKADAPASPRKRGLQTNAGRGMLCAGSESLLTTTQRKALAHDRAPCAPSGVLSATGRRHRRHRTRPHRVACR